MGFRIPGRRVQTRPLQIPRATAASFGAAEGAALQDIGAGLQDISDELERERQRATTATARATNFTFEKDRQNFMYGPDGIMGRTAGNSLNIVQELAEYDRKQRETIEAIPDQDQRELVLGHFMGSSLRSNTTAARRQINRTQTFNNETLLAENSVLDDSAVNDSSQANRARVDAETAANIRNLFAPEEGVAFTPEQKENLETITERRILEDRYQRYGKILTSISENNPVLGQAFFLTNEESFDPDIRERLRKDLDETANIRRAQGIALALHSNTVLTEAEKNEQINSISDPKMKAGVRKETDRLRSDTQNATDDATERNGMANYDQINEALNNGATGPQANALVNNNLDPQYQEWLRGVIRTRTSRRAGYTPEEKRSSVIKKYDLIRAAYSTKLQDRLDFIKLDLTTVAHLFTDTDFNELIGLQRETAEGEREWRSISSRRGCVSGMIEGAGLEEESDEAAVYMGEFEILWNDAIASGAIPREEADSLAAYQRVEDLIFTRVTTDKIGTVDLAEALRQQRDHPERSIDITGPKEKEGFPIPRVWRNDVVPFEEVVDGVQRLGWARREDAAHIILYELGGTETGTRITVAPDTVLESNRSIVNTAVRAFSQPLTFGAGGAFVR